jgi:endonuclease YncB( thermonuclease family)
MRRSSFNFGGFWPSVPLPILLLALGIVIAVAIALWLRPPAPPLVGMGRASDGDSFVLGTERVRLEGLDAPELDQTCLSDTGAVWACGHAARDGLADLLAAGPVHCLPGRRDHYGRLLATCSSDGHDLGAQLVRQGFALSAGDYWSEHLAARAAVRGIWAGSFDLPANWRSSHPR